MKLLLTVAVVFVSTLSTFAWTELTGNVRGIVTNIESGQVVRGATLRLVPFNGGEPTDVAKAFSQDEGEYIFANVIPGIYNVECSAFGYKTTRIIGLQVREDRTKLAYFKLQRGPAAEVVEVYTYASLEAKQQVKTKTTAATEEALGTAPATVYIVTAEDIEDRGYNSLGEVLIDIPEFQIQYNHSPEDGNLVSARGIAGNEKLLILLDGHRYNSMMSSSYAILENYNIRYAERIECIVGPASALYGADAYMGVVNIISKKGNKIKGFGLSTEYGMYNSTQTSFTGGLGNEKVAFSIQGSFFQTDGPNMPELYPNDFDWYNRVYSQTGAVIGSLTDPRATTTLPIRPFYQGRRTFHVGTQFSYKDFHLRLNFNSETHSSSMGTQAQYSPYWKEASFGDRFANINAEQSYFKKNKKMSAKTMLDFSTVNLYGNSKIVNTFSGYKDAFRTASDAGIRLTQDYTYIFNKNHRITVGLYGQHSTALPQTSNLTKPINRLFQSIVPIDPVALDLHYIGTNATDQDGNSLKIYQNFYYLRRIITGAFLEYKGQLGKHWFITAGMRYDQVFEISEYDPNKNLRTYFSISPRIGVVYKPADEFVAKVFVGRGFLQPPPGRKYNHYGVFSPTPAGAGNGNYTHIQGGFWRLPNPDLLPETTNAIEASLRYAKGDFLASVNSYFNTIYGNWTVATLTEDISFLGIPLPIAERTINSKNPIFTYGANVVIAYRIAFGKEEQYKFRFNANYSYANGYQEELNFTPFTATHVAKFGVLFKLKRFSWYNSLRFLSATHGQGFTDADGNLFQNTSPSYFVWNTFMRYRILDKSKIQLSLFVRANNVLDNRYYNVTDNSIIALGAAPQDPLIITGGLTVNFGRLR